MKALRDASGEQRRNSGSSLAEAILLRAASTWAGAGVAEAAPVDPVGAVRRAGATPAATLATQAQIALARAALAGAGVARPAAARFPAFLARVLAHFLSPDGEPGLAESMAADGGVLQSRRTLAGHAWMARALAQAYAATRSSEILVLAELVLDYPDAHLADGAAGYFEDNQGGGERRQSSHATLLDALLTLHAATGAPNWLARATNLIELFRDHIVAPSHAVGEMFDREWRASSGVGGAQPGAAARWVALLGRAREAGIGAGAERLMLALGAQLLALRDERGLVPATAPTQGRAASFRLRDQIHLCAALEALGRREPRLLDERRFLEARIAALFIDPAPAGCWCESVDARGVSLGAPVEMETLAVMMLHVAEAAQGRKRSARGDAAIHAA